VASTLQGAPFPTSALICIVLSARRDVNHKVKIRSASRSPTAGVAHAALDLLDLDLLQGLMECRRSWVIGRFRLLNGHAVEPTLSSQACTVWVRDCALSVTISSLPPDVGREDRCGHIGVRGRCPATLRVRM
jgi:hypothetical protein